MNTFWGHPQNYHRGNRWSPKWCQKRKMRLIIFNKGLRAKYRKKSVFSREVDAWMLLFFWEDNTSRGLKKIMYFSSGGPPPWHNTPSICVNTEIIRYFVRWGDFEEKVGRQGKVYQNVCNEPNYSKKIHLVHMTPGQIMPNKSVIFADIDNDNCDWWKHERYGLETEQLGVWSPHSWNYNGLR